jgi:hypothetical protein
MIKSFNEICIMASVEAKIKGLATIEVADIQITCPKNATGAQFIKKARAELKLKIADLQISKNGKPSAERLSIAYKIDIINDFLNS